MDSSHNFGSPGPKSDIFQREIAGGGIEFPALFLGDSRLDHEVATEHEMEFLFVSQWTDFEGWEGCTDSRGIGVIPSRSTLLNKAPDLTIGV